MAEAAAAAELAAAALRNPSTCFSRVKEGETEREEGKEEEEVELKKKEREGAAVRSPPVFSIKTKERREKGGKP